MMQPGKKLFPKNLSFKNKCRLLKPSNTLKLFFQLIQTLFNPLKKKKKKQETKHKQSTYFKSTGKLNGNVFVFDWLTLSIPAPHDPPGRKQSSSVN